MWNGSFLFFFNIYFYYLFAEYRKTHPGCLHLNWTLATPVVSSKRFPPPIFLKKIVNQRCENDVFQAIKSTPIH